MSKPTSKIKNCCYCGRRSGIVKMTREHLIPLSKGGSHHKSNLRPCCERCNTNRGNKDLYLWQIEVKNMLLNMDYGLFSFEELLRVVKNIESIKLIVSNSTPSMWHSGKVGVIEKIRKIKTYG